MKIFFLSLMLACSTCLVSCAALPEKTPAEIAANHRLEQAVQSALDQATDLYGNHLDIRADNGEVRLSGIVTDDYQMVRAVRITAKVVGVKKVVNDIEIDNDGHGKVE